MSFSFLFLSFPSFERSDLLVMRIRPALCGCFYGPLLLICIYFFRFPRIAVHPSGRSYASGGEDGFVRVHHFDEGYFRAKPYGDVGEIYD